MTDCAGKAILVLGGSRGIGAAAVRRPPSAVLWPLAATSAFFKIGSREAAQALAADTGSMAFRCDSADNDTLARDRPALGILVVNAGLTVGGDLLALDADVPDIAPCW